MLKPEITLTLVYPFWTKTAARPLALHERREKTAALQASLRGSLGADDAFEAKAYAHPPSLVRRKESRLQRSVELEEPLVSAAFENLPKGLVRLTKHFWQIEYVDLGLGVFELVMRCEVDWSDMAGAAADLGCIRQRLAPIGRSADIAMLESGLNFEIVAYQERLNQALGKAFESADIAAKNWLANAAPRASSRLDAMNVSLFVQTAEPGAPASALCAEVAVVASALCGETVTAETAATGNPFAPFIFCGNAGAIACVDGDAAYHRVSRLWKSLVMYWGALHECANGAYLRALSLDTAAKSEAPFEEVNQISRARHLIDQLVFEARPENLTTETLEKIPYERLWAAWSTDALIGTLTTQSAQMEQRILELNTRISQSFSARFNFILLAITIVTVAGVSAEVIGFLDADGVILPDPLLRSVAVGASVLVFALASLLLLVRRRR